MGYGRYPSIVSFTCSGFLRPATAISTSPCPALAIDIFPTPMSLWNNDWSTCSNRTSECRTSRVRLDKIPFRRMERFVVISKEVVFDSRNQTSNRTIKTAGIPHICGASEPAEIAATTLAARRTNTTSEANGRVRNIAGLTFSKSCSSADFSGATCGATTVTDGAACAGGLGAGIGGGGGAELTGGDAAGMDIALPQPGQFADFPAYFDGALIPLPQLEHSTRIGTSTSPEKTTLIDKSIVIWTLSRLKVAVGLGIEPPSPTRHWILQVRHGGTDGVSHYISSIHAHSAPLYFLRPRNRWGFPFCFPLLVCHERLTSLLAVVRTRGVRFAVGCSSSLDRSKKLQEAIMD